MILYDGISGRYVYKTPETLEELVLIMGNYLKEKHQEEGRKSAQYEIRTALGLEE